MDFLRPTIYREILRQLVRVARPFNRTLISVDIHATHKMAATCREGPLFSTVPRENGIKWGKKRATTLRAYNEFSGRDVVLYILST